MIRRISITLLVQAIIICVSGISFAGISPNYRIYPSNITQTETFIVTHPFNSNIMFSSANTINLSNGFISEGIYITTNAGQSWFGSDSCKGSPVNFHRGDPAITIDKNGRFIITRLGFSPGLFSHYSTDNGVTWSGQRTLSLDDQDRGSLVSDIVPSSAFYGRTYASWVKLGNPFPVNMSYSDDGGATWVSQFQVNNPIQRSQGAEVTIGPNGEVYITWAGVIPNSPFTEDFVGFAKSTNGGQNWIVTENAFDINGIQGILSEKSNIRVNGLPKITVDFSNGVRHGWIYIVTTQKNLSPAGSDPDVIFYKSSDGGATWSSGIRVNQDPLNNGKIQYFPAIHVDDDGGINVIYYDDRNTTSDSTGVFLSRSMDGGDTWNDFQISDANFKPVAIGGLGQGYQGDNIDLTTSGNILWPLWMDNRSGIYQIWTVPINLDDVSVEKLSGELPDGYSLSQNFPNPFNPNTKIVFEVPNSNDNISLVVFDAVGRKVSTLVDQSMKPGKYSVVFNGNDLPSGIYFYNLSSGEISITKKMILVK
ncbi:MAG: T9SS type A sorting domain-containing protein [Ignavibacteriaceae bacterium]|nr:MAG: T9SS C-terminal target domain-containing protein [Chlorobiota bacterium]MBW7855239.1 T9SS type A sorting domain-containing protein [Ignavibacteria bacterium]MCC6886050.1 T9SS type A sorting domain-containing protein [Ignavibacteriales bacterium]MCE7952699.1 T9SS C-terminal target domain-containing protein [Chlorobi bacterium CHB7]MDL1886810.1 T9SS type A sorting domain-containing protein [Ignavibacteria bacterium CHB1]MEB2330280.1 T9SS type A sorting domain-containing protein [Ignaviba